MRRTSRQILPRAYCPKKKKRYSQSPDTSRGAAAAVARTRAAHPTDISEPEKAAGASSEEQGENEHAANNDLAFKTGHPWNTAPVRRRVYWVCFCLVDTKLSICSFARKGARESLLGIVIRDKRGTGQNPPWCCRHFTRCDPSERVATCNLRSTRHHQRRPICVPTSAPGKVPTSRSEWHVRR